ncbi:S1C family serine protease [Ferdinandcohnia quinoae]|uniref:Trypsin-like peptidase domain-containing protein n=1 Tax=Fredinandcohnia quinoae TaxID=2918902 RepID=A0AAW5EAF5_9BACI|nr:trypsin-like peptidase domain-containing protein [Fredinandcohnia sp. SECRCQ15]MCH1626396.1 trypsin-like peptidase domain-containing protein [Fredinandcohnia sp. SECRCQ15]
MNENNNDNINNHDEPIEKEIQSNQLEELQRLDRPVDTQPVQPEKIVEMEQSNQVEQAYQPVQMEEPTQVKEFEQLRSTQHTNQPVKKSKPKVKSFLSMIAAGVVGSVLTLTVAPHTDGLQDLFNSDSNPKVEHAEDSVAASGSVKIQPTATKAGETSIADIVEQSSKAIVGIVNLQKQQNIFGQQSSSDVESGSGSGVIFQKKGDIAYIVTNNHVVEGANNLEVSLYNGEKVNATLIGSDALTDLAVLKIDAKNVEAVLSFGDSSVLRPGDQVLAIGNPLGLDLSRTVTQGIVSATDRSVSVSTSAGDWALNVIQTDAAINPGNSGGALINTEGQVIGINSLKISDSGVEGLGFAIPSNDAVPIINQIIEKGHIERPYIGIGLASLEEVPQMYYNDLPDKVKGGVMVTNVAENSSAAKAGIQVQDVIVSINDNEITNSMDLRKFLYTKSKIGDEVEIGLFRSGQYKKVKLTLTSTTSQID